MPASMVFRHAGREYVVDVLDAAHVRVDGRIVEARLERDGVVRFVGGASGSAWTAASGNTRWVFYDGRVYELELATGGRRRRTGGHHGSLTAPMPATVLRILVAPGAAVSRGDTVILLEAMKMELPVRATANGVVEAVNCREGDLVQPGVSLIDLEET